MMSPLQSIESVDKAAIGPLLALQARKEELEREKARIEREIAAIEARVGELLGIESGVDCASTKTYAVII